MKIGKYALVELVATGGMAELWLARQEGPGGFARTVAIKRVLPHHASDERFVQMFLDEAQLAALLSHPNIVHILDFGEDGGEYYLAMEFIRGRSLDDVLDRQAARGERLPIELAAHVVAQACVGLHYAHRFTHPETGEPLRLVHRDVSPQNLMVSYDGLVKVMDFGIAKATTSRVRTETGTVKGKYAYMSPEQIAGTALDARSDVFALGIVLYEAVTGVRPFGTDSDLLAITAILNEPPKPIRQFVPDFPGELEAVISRALAKDRDDRYPDARAMQDDLEAFLRTRPAAVGPTTVAAHMAGLFGEGSSAPPAAAHRPADRRVSGSEPTAALTDGDVEDLVPTRISDTVDPMPTIRAERLAPPTAPGAARPAVAPPTAPEAARPAVAPPLPVGQTGSSGLSAGLVLSLMGVLLLLGVGGLAWSVLRGGKAGGASPADAGGAGVADADEALDATLQAGLPAGHGLVRIVASPGSAVFLDDRSLGPAPVDPQVVPAGPHRVRALSAAGAPFDGTVSVVGGERTVVRVP